MAAWTSNREERAARMRAAGTNAAGRPTFASCTMARSTSCSRRSASEDHVRARIPRCEPIASERSSTNSAASFHYCGSRRTLVAGVLAGTSLDECWQLCCPSRKRSFITPMAAVAGAVAEEILIAMTAQLHIDEPMSMTAATSLCISMPGENFVIGMVERPDRPSTSLAGRMLSSMIQRARHCDQRMAWPQFLPRDRGCSHCPCRQPLPWRTRPPRSSPMLWIFPDIQSIQRVPACELSPDSDLGNRLVTTAVGELTRGSKSDCA